MRRGRYRPRAPGWRGSVPSKHCPCALPPRLRPPLVMPVMFRCLTPPSGSAAVFRDSPSISSPPLQHPGPSDSQTCYKLQVKEALRKKGGKKDIMFLEAFAKQKSHIGEMEMRGKRSESRVFRNLAPSHSFPPQRVIRRWEASAG